MQKSLEHLDDYLEELLLKDDNVNCSDFTERMTADMIGRNILGIDIGVLKRGIHEKNEFMNYINTYRSSFWKETIKNFLPQLYNLIGYYMFDNAAVQQYYINFITNIMQHRKTQAIDKSNLLSFLMKMKENPGKLAELIGKSSSLSLFIFFFSF